MLWKLPLSEHGAHGLICCRLDPVANDPTGPHGARCAQTRNATLRER